MFNLGQIFMTIGANRDGKLQPARCASCGICYGRYPHTDDGMDVRPIFHKLRLLANENFNEHYNDIFDGHGQIPTNGLLALSDLHQGAVSVYQLALLQRLEDDLDLCVGLKAFLKAA